MKTITMIALALTMVGAAQPTPAQAGWWDDVKSFFSRVGTPADEVGVSWNGRGIALGGKKRQQRSISSDPRDPTGRPGPDSKYR